MCACAQKVGSSVSWKGENNGGGFLAFHSAPLLGSKCPRHYSLSCDVLRSTLLLLALVHMPVSGSQHSLEGITMASNEKVCHEEAVAFMREVCSSSPDWHIMGVHLNSPLDTLLNLLKHPCEEIFEVAATLNSVTNKTFLSQD